MNRITTKKISLWITCGVKYDYYVKYVDIIIHQDYSVINNESLYWWFKKEKELLILN